MKKRMLGNTGIMIGEVGIGCEGLIGKSEKFIYQALDMMEEAGANGIDLYSPNPEMRSALGKAMQGRRNKFVLEAHICTIWQNDQYKRTRKMDEIKKGFEDQLSLLRTDHLEIGMIHYVDSFADWDGILDNGILDYVGSLKKGGIVQAIGMSSHNPETALRAINEGDIEVLLFSINPCYDLQPASEDVEQLWNREKYAGQLVNMDSARAELYETCARKGIGITVMKAFGGGDLLKAEQSLAGIALTADQCIAYALDRPGVACVFAGAHTLDELKTSLDFANSTREERDYATTLASFPRISWKGHCMYCGHCAPCPEQINIAEVTRLLNLSLAQGSIPETVRDHYDLLGAKGGNCIQCGVCETRCPFDVPVRENMKKAKETFGC